MRLALLLPILLAVTPVPAAAQDDDTDQQVCITPLRLWFGSTEEIRRLRQMPIPESYRRVFNPGGPCGRGTLYEPALIDAHLGFGDEASVTAALAFLAADHARGHPAPGDLARLLAEAQRAAAPDLAEALAVPSDPPGARYSAVRPILSRPAVTHLRALVHAQQDYMFLARQYLRAADFHHSRTLYERARHYFDPALAGYRLLYRDRTPMADAVSDVEGWIGLQTHHINEMHDLEMRMAVLRASLTRAPGDVTAAQAVVARYHDPLLDEGAALVSERRDPCDIEDPTSLTALQEACRQENSFTRRLSDYWQARARLDLLIAAEPERYGLPAARDRWLRLESFENALVLIGWDRPRQEGNRPFLRYSALDDAEVELRLRHADLLDRLARARGAGIAEWRGQDAYDAGALRDSALQEYAAASRIATPSGSAGRFRQAATGYLAAYRLFPRVEPAAVFAREATYFRTVLANLDRIVGAEP